jgi:heme-degrading monooxygenase HmoA
MFARSVSIRLKPNVAVQFARAIGKESMPRLRRQKGFRDEITFLAPGGREAVAISLWERKEDADAYRQGAYSEVLRTLGDVIEGVPHVRTYEVCHSSFHNVAALAAAPPVAA